MSRGGRESRGPGAVEPVETQVPPCGAPVERCSQLHPARRSPPCQLPISPPPPRSPTSSGGSRTSCVGSTSRTSTAWWCSRRQSFGAWRSSCPIGRPCGSWQRRPAGHPTQRDRGPHGPARPSHLALLYEPRGIFEVPIRRSALGLPRGRGRAHGAAEVHRGKAPGRDVTASSCQALTPRSSARRWPRNASQQT